MILRQETIMGAQRCHPAGYISVSLRRHNPQFAFSLDHLISSDPTVDSQLYIMPLRRQNAMLSICSVPPPPNIVHRASTFGLLLAAMDNMGISSVPAPSNTPLKKSLYKAKRGPSNPKATSRRKAPPPPISEYKWIATDPWIDAKSKQTMCVGCRNALQFSDSVSSRAAREEWLEHKMKCMGIRLQKISKQQKMLADAHDL
ncbi:hypothetical protein EDD18DRAFT_1156894 [Armillaria luteobubalina]|uniref:Uncharacterized protein n=1 Tax=Armillaria luteobubalina TaxID=153913 RepID=A0AA39QAQ0_9AGAR|nr:hypothetical protein EDD18DRAFT_1156894 [Armillaria luteobubalina]